MITKEQVMPLLVNDCPSFAQKWQEDRAFFGDEEHLYIDFGEFAGHIVDLYERNQTQEFLRLFSTIEQLQVEGDDYVREAATVGLLEGIQNIAGNRGIDPEEFVQYLKPESAKSWKKLNDFWDGKEV